MGNPLSPVLANIFMAKLEFDVVRPLTHRFTTGMFMIVSPKRKKDNPDDLLERLNSSHPSIVSTVEEDPDHFLDTSFTYGNKFNCKVYKKQGKLPTH